MVGTRLNARVAVELELVGVMASEAAAGWVTLDAAVDRHPVACLVEEAH